MTQRDILKDAMAKVLPEVDAMLGWRMGNDPLRAQPYRIRTAEDLDQLVFNPLCVNNLSVQLMHLRGKKVGIPVKGCDSRSVVQMLQEKVISRESVVVFGLPCTGVVDLKKIARIAGLDTIDALDIADRQASLTIGGQTTSLPLADVLADKCLTCRYPNPVIYDHLVGEPVEPWAPAVLPQMEAFALKSLQERFAYWQGQMDRCIRCYACRNACPLCFCRDVCLCDSRDPHWQSQETSIREKFMVQAIHAMHLAGRCTECGECERSCPVDIPLLTMKREMNAIIKALFNYESGVDPEAVPPLMTFQVIEETFKEITW